MCEAWLLSAAPLYYFIDVKEFFWYCTNVAMLHCRSLNVVFVRRHVVLDLIWSIKTSRRPGAQVLLPPSRAFAKSLCFWLLEPSSFRLCVSFCVPSVGPNPAEGRHWRDATFRPSFHQPTMYCKWWLVDRQSCVLCFQYQSIILQLHKNTLIKKKKKKKAFDLQTCNVFRREI